MKYGLHCLCIALMLLGVEIAAADQGQQSAASNLVVDVNAVSPQVEDGYYLRLLKMLLDASREEAEQIQYHYADRQFSQQRWMVELSNEVGNGVLWTVTTQAREQHLLAFKQPLMRGLIGLRLLVIRQADSARFAQIKHLNDLKALVACQGSQWPDTQVLLANGLKVKAGMDIARMYKMLAIGRCDYFPRGVTELALEEHYLQQHNLLAAEDVLLAYPQAMYFFVNKRNLPLLQRLALGWQKLAQTGELDRFFFAQPHIQRAMVILARPNKVVIKLHNPEAPDDLPVPSVEDWLAQAASHLPKLESIQP